jgi:hypothetical protein
MNDDPMKIVTPVFKVSFPVLFEPEGYEGNEPKYSVTMMFPKDTDIKPLRQILNQAARETFGKNIPPKLINPLRDGDNDEEREEYRGFWVCKALSKYQPYVCGKNRHKVITDETEIYAGCWGRAAVKAFGYKTGKKGLSLILLSFQKLRDDEPIAGGPYDGSGDFDDEMSEEGTESDDFNDDVDLDLPF